MSGGLAPVSSLSVVVPCFNEEGAVATVVRNALVVGRALVERLEVVVVDDGSTDATSAIVRELSFRHPEVHLVSHASNRGYGAALRSGFEAARHEHVFFTDGDGQFDLTDLPRLLSLCDRFEVIAGYRRIRNDSALRRLNGALWTWLTNLTLGADVRDVNCAFKVLPRSLLLEADLRSEGALISAELLSEARRLGYSVGEIDVMHRPRSSGRPTGARASVIRRAFMELFDLLARRLVRPAALASR